MDANLAKDLWNKLKHSFVGRAANILWISIRCYRDGKYAQSAVALTYYSLFAIVPLAALFFGIAKGFDLDVKLRMTLTERLSQHKELLEYVCRFADTTLKQARGGVVAGAGVAALFFAVIGLYSNIERALNAVWGLPPRRNLMHRFSNYISCMVVMPMLMVMISSVGMFLRPLAEQNSAAGFVITRIMPFVLTSAVFFLVYLLIPNTRVRILPALAAGIVAGIGFQVLQNVFVMMQRSIFRYNQLYGSFAALPLFMIWLRWSWEIALFGAELGFVAQNIDTGMFDSSGSTDISIHSRRLRELAVARNIYAKFFSGKGSSTFVELGDALKLPAVCLERELTELIAAKVICRVDDSLDSNAYVPLQPATLTIAGCLRMLDDSGDETALSALGTTEGKLIAAEARLRDALLKCSDNTPLVEVGGPDAPATAD